MESIYHISSKFQGRVPSLESIGSRRGRRKMNDSTRSANLIKWQRFSITALLGALLLTVSYSNSRIQQAKSEAAIARHQADSWRQEAEVSQMSLKKERDITEGLKSCMTFDQAYIRELEARLGKRSTGLPKKP